MGNPVIALNCILLYNTFTMQQQSIPWEKIKGLEREIKALKSLGNKVGKKETKEKKDSLYGILKGITFSEEEIEEAQKAIFNFKANK